MQRACVVLVMLAASVPAAFERPDAPRIAEETLVEARRRGFLYRRGWQRAAAGDPRAIRALLEFSADAAGGLGHGVALTELADRIGDARMAAAFQGLDPSLRLRARRYLEVGVAYRVEWQDPSLAPSLYPLSWAASQAP